MDISTSALVACLIIHVCAGPPGYSTIPMQDVRAMAQVLKDWDKLKANTPNLADDQVNLTVKIMTDGCLPAHF